MAKASFKIAFERTMIFEKEFSDHPKDPGGRTVWGISKVNWPHMYENGDPTFEEAETFYRTHFWLKSNLGILESQRVANEIFDTAVNIGRTNANRYAQKTFNFFRRQADKILPLKVDGVIGQKSLVAINAFTSYRKEYETAFYNRLNVLQAHWYDSIGSEDFLIGWYAKRLG